MSAVDRLRAVPMLEVVLLPEAALCGVVLLLVVVLLLRPGGWSCCYWKS